MEYKCSICLDSLFSVNTDVSVTKCGHLFHKSCLENWNQTNSECPNCKTITTNTVTKIHPDVFDELVYTSPSNKTETFLESILNFEKERKVVLLKIIKNLDKENTNLKATNKTYKENIGSSKTFLEIFQKNQKDWQEKIQKLQLENKNLLNEIGKLENEKEFNTKSEQSPADCGNEIKTHSCEDSSCSIEVLPNKSLLSLFFN